MLKLIRNTLSNTGARIVTLILGIIATPILIKAVGDEGYGLLMLIPTITGYFNLLGGGVPGGAVKFIAEYEAKDDWAMINNIINSALVFFLIIGALVCGGLLIFTHFGGLSFFKISVQNVSAAKTILMIAAFLALLSWPSNALTSTLEGVQEHHRKNVVMTSTTIMSIFAAICAAKLGADIIQVFLAQNAAYVIRWIWLTWTVKRVVPQWRPNPLGGSMSTFKMIFGLSVWMLALAIASMLNYELDKLIIGSALPVAMLTVYDVITRPFKLVQQASSMFNSAVMPAVSSYEAKQGRAGLDVFIYTGVRYNNLLVGALAITATYFCAPFVALWVGERFLKWIWVAQLSCAFQMVWQSNSMLGRVFYGTGKVERIAIIALINAILNAGLSIILVQYIGVAGVILSTVIIGCLAVPAQYIFVFPQLDIPRWGYFKRSIVRAQWPLWIAALAMLPLWSTIQSIRNWWVLVPSALAMLFSLVALCWITGVAPEHKKWISQTLKNRLKPQ